jgi:hypothetical protein
VQIRRRSKSGVKPIRGGRYLALTAGTVELLMAFFHFVTLVARSAAVRSPI